MSPSCIPVLLALLLVASARGSPLETRGNDLGDEGLGDDGLGDEAANEYFANIDVSLFYGEPDEATGARVASLRRGDAVNPETLGSYFEGDLLLPSSSDAVEDSRNSLPSPSSRWPGGVVPYTISGPFTSDELATLQFAFNTYAKYTCVRWVPRVAQTDYVTIQGNDTGCWAAAGRVGGQQLINLQRPACLWENGSVLHELNHAVGFLHEQSRVERDDFITINWANILASQSFNFNKWTPALDGLGVAYDYGSVMHYEPYAFSSNGKKTIENKRPLNGLVMGQRVGLSSKDIIKVNRLYNCIGYQMG